MRKYYIDLEKDEAPILDILSSLKFGVYRKNIKITRYGYEVYILNPLEEKIKYPENSEITFYIVRTLKGLKIDWIKSVYNYQKHK
ncbi:hypothetical protein [Marinitoga lauensis]|uniref:hypothetical protein n=1 Tax=Marinitoga lauensis TaxID=2201189 RepID=UPI0010134F90|nr:hypothetical protein [Marinitoga lauensis]